MTLLKKQSGFALPITILIVVVLIAGGGIGYYFYKTSEKQKEAERVKSEQVVDETVDWEVYKDGGYGYELKYPDDFHVVIETTKISDLPEKTETGLGLTEALNEQDLIYNSNIDDNCSMVGVSMLRQTAEVLIPQGTKSYCKIKQFGQIKGKLQKFNLEEHRMEEYKEIGEYSYSSFQMHFIFYRKGARISLSIGRNFLLEPQSLDRNMRIAKFNEYFDSVAARDPANPDLISYDTFEKVLSTLKFVEESKIADWGTYQNKEYGFSFAHPRNFRMVEDYYCGISSLYMENPVVFEFALIQDIYPYLTQNPVICLEVVKTDKTIEQLLDYLKEATNKQAKLQVENLESPYYGWPPPDIKSVKTVTIGGLKMTKVVHDRGPGVPLTSLLQYYVRRLDYVLVFSANYSTLCSSGGGDCGATEKEVLPRILSTLKFIKE